MSREVAKRNYASPSASIDAAPDALHQPQTQKIGQVMHASFGIHSF